MKRKLANMGFKFKLDFEEQVVYDEKANVSVDGIPQFNQKIINQLNDKSYPIKTFEINLRSVPKMEKVNFYQLANNINDLKKTYISVWERLWKYFNVEDYMEKLFPDYEKGIEVSSEEKEFLEELLNHPYYIDGRVSKPNDKQKEIIQWVAKNLFQMIERRTTITEDIQERFFVATKRRSLTGEIEFEYIIKRVESLKRMVFEDKKKGKYLNIKEKEVWSVEVERELEKVIDKYEKVYYKMYEIKTNEKDIYWGGTQPECLLDEAKKQLKDDYDSKK